ncbi:MAG TPA: rRNA maturation RNase YbeY [Gemmatimonadales bacterium]|nr:rRNA maturation RNase YbeY [Gemmatimonadales bacterium]
MPVTTEVAVAGRSPLGAARTGDAVRAVLRGERRRATISVTFVGRDRMRSLNRRYKGSARATDVLAFGLPQPGGGLAGDVYICVWRARAQARTLGITAREELVRLVVHGTLHVLGWDHPEDETRDQSDMWRRQERYVRSLR